MNSSTGMATNAYGLYSITLHTGRCVLQCSMLGYTTWSDTLQLSDNTVVDIALQPNDYLLKGVEVLGARKHSGQFMLDAQKIQALPVVGGEPDLIKTLQFLRECRVAMRGQTIFLYGAVTNGEIWSCWMRL